MQNGLLVFRHTSLGAGTKSGVQKAKSAAHQSWRDPYLSYESCANSERHRQPRSDAVTR